MAHRRGFGQIRKLPSGRWQARYTGPDTALHNANTTFDLKKSAEKWLGTEQDLIADGRLTPPARRKAEMIAAAKAAEDALTVGQYVEQIIQRRENRSRRPIVPTTADTYRKDWRLRGADLDAVPLADLTPAQVSSWWHALPASSRTSNVRCYDLLKSVLADAVEDELIEKNPCRVKGAGKPPSGRKGVALTVPEVLAYLAAVPEHYRLPLMIPAWCGLRSGEVRGLRRRDVASSIG